jgi:hypothetical protein
MKKNSLLLLAAALLVLVPSPARAQQLLTFDTLQIDLWPEYDQPAMLVIMRGHLAPDTDYPANIAIRIPARAGPPHAVATRADGGPPLDAQYEFETAGEWATIRLAADVPGFQIEYYDDNIEFNGNSRQFEFTWHADYAVQNVVMLVQQPTGAENMTTFPQLISVTQDSLGLFYYGGDIGALAAGETLELTVTYEKRSDALTVNFLPLDSSEPVTAKTPGRVTLSSYLPLGLGTLGVLAIAVGLYWYWATDPARRRAKPRGRRSPRARPPAVEPALKAAAAVGESAFCHQCGKRAEAGDRFCRACGTELRP